MFVPKRQEHTPRRLLPRGRLHAAPAIIRASTCWRGGLRSRHAPHQLLLSANSYLDGGALCIAWEPTGRPTACSFYCSLCMVDCCEKLMCVACMQIAIKRQRKQTGIEDQVPGWKLQFVLHAIFCTTPVENWFSFERSRFQFVTWSMRACMSSRSFKVHGMSLEIFFPQKILFISPCI
jgi:hypothetical protein